MKEPLTLEQKLEVIKSYGIEVEYYKYGAYKVLNHQEIFNISEIGNAIGECRMEVSRSCVIDKTYFGHIYFICLEMPWGGFGIQKIASEIGNEKVATVEVYDNPNDAWSGDALYYTEYQRYDI